ncbi:MAG: hypothetical protein ACREE9_03835 [Stellaceae bacterium]
MRTVINNNEWGTNMPWTRKNAGAEFAVSLRGVLLPMLALLAALPGICATGPADAASKPIYFDESSIVGIGRTVTALRVPIETAPNTFIYKDVTIELTADAKGNLEWATKEPISALSPPLATSNIRAGIYLIPTCSQCGIQITGPTSIGNGGEAEWTITPAPGTKIVPAESPPNPAVFYTGPLAGNPLAARLENAGLTSAQYAYGEIGASSLYGAWYPNGLIGLRLVGNELVVAAFTDSGEIDHNVPWTQIIYMFSH